MVGGWPRRECDAVEGRMVGHPSPMEERRWNVLIAVFGVFIENSRLKVKRLVVSAMATVWLRGRLCDNIGSIRLGRDEYGDRCGGESWCSRRDSVPLVFVGRRGWKRLGMRMFGDSLTGKWLNQLGRKERPLISAIRIGGTVLLEIRCLRLSDRSSHRTFRQERPLLLATPAPLMRWRSVKGPTIWREGATCYLGHPCGGTA
ncbi:hypothetical protein QBC34DRAFT_20190 [Podospora aff. communis PSN243]|uniref:Uncharacterized protein n=1 Tax=Podospora aff. communis PSN243 TaxID=3040156 RepID=A0AAV9GY23_9PEZI|nr:hypothetical protein QBC34DRAFT_20190 [Podospora aff. communis PSN243]